MHKEMIRHILIVVLIALIISFSMAYLLGGSTCLELREVPFRYEGNFWGIEKVRTVSENSDGMMMECAKFNKARFFHPIENLNSFNGAWIGEISK